MIYLVLLPSPPQRWKWPCQKACLSVNHPRTIHLRGRHCSALYRRRLYLHCCHGRLSSNLNFVTVGESGFTEEREQKRTDWWAVVNFFFFFCLSVTVKLCRRKREEVLKSSLRFVLFSFFLFSLSNHLSRDAVHPSRWDWVLLGAENRSHW